MRDYQEAISAKNENWKSEARDLMQSGVEFVIVHLKPDDYRDCNLLAREFGYSECLEDELPLSQEKAQSKSFKPPTRIGFVKLGLSKSKADHRLKE